MRKLLKWIIGLLALLALLAAGALVYASTALGPRIRRDLQEGLRTALHVPVSVDAVEFSPFRGVAEIRGFGIWNPDGFSNAHLFTTSAFSVTFSPLRLLSGRLHVRSVLLRRPDLTWESRGGFDTNWRATFAQLEPGHKKRDRPSASAPDTSSRKHGGIHIDTIRIEEAVVRLVSMHAPTNRPPVRLPTFEITRPGQPGGDSTLSILLKLTGALAVGLQPEPTTEPPGS